MGRYVKATLTYRPIGGFIDGEWAVAAPRRQDNRQPGELVDAQLGRARPLGVAHSPGFVALRNGSTTSIGNGKTIVVFWLLPISSSVCR